MSLRTRLILASAAIVLIPIAILAFGLRQDMARRLSQEYQLRVDRAVEVIRQDLARASATIGDRLASLERALVADNRFRLATVAGLESEREYLLEYAGTAMRLTGLSMLQIQDDEERIISSGHFRNEHGRLESGLASALSRAGNTVLITTRGAAGEFLTLARVEQFHIGGRSFTIVGGLAVDDAFLARLARDGAIVVTLEYPGGKLSTGGAPPADVAVGELRVPLIRTLAPSPIETVEARLEVTQPMAPLRTLLRRADSWFLVTAVATAITTLLLAVWVSSRISSRLTALAEKTAVLDLDRLDVDFDPGTDEVGTLSRLLGDLATRLRTSTTRVREAERRATIGDLARQINHDIKNGLIPLRNVMRHFAQVAEAEPSALPVVFAERRQTLDSSIAYLETLARSYQRLSPPPVRRECDVNALITDIVRVVQGADAVELRTDLTPNLPRVIGDPVALRRILENLTANAVDSLESQPGCVTLSTQVVDRAGEPPLVRVTVADTGRGMAAEEVGQIFNDFYTTKESGAGLGLSIVRRLVMDFSGTLSVDSEPGKGTRMVVDIPAGMTRT